MLNGTLHSTLVLVERRSICEKGPQKRTDTTDVVEGLSVAAVKDHGASLIRSAPRRSARCVGEMQQRQTELVNQYATK